MGPQNVPECLIYALSRILSWDQHRLKAVFVETHVIVPQELKVHGINLALTRTADEISTSWVPLTDGQSMILWEAQDVPDTHSETLPKIKSLHGLMSLCLLCTILVILSRGGWVCRRQECAPTPARHWKYLVSNYIDWDFSLLRPQSPQCPTLEISH